MRILLKSDDYNIYDTDQLTNYCIKLNLKQKINTSNTLVFSILPNCPNIDKINKLTSVIKLFEYNENGNDLMFKGRVIDTVDTIDGIRTFTCEGCLGYLNDTIQPLNVYQEISIIDYLKDKLNNHNLMVEDNKKIFLGRVTLPGSKLSFVDHRRLTTMDDIQETLIKVFGGYLEIEDINGVNYLNYLEDYDHINSQVIEFKKNILDLERYISSVDLITALIPLGAKEEETNLPLTIASVNNGKDYLIDETSANKYGMIFGVKEYGDINNPMELMQKANDDLANATKLSLSLNISAIDLSLSDVNVEKIRFGDIIRCKSVEHNLNEAFICTVLEKDYLNPANSKITLDKTISTSSDIAVTINRDLNTISTNISTDQSVFQSMIEHQTGLINGINGGSIYTETKDGKPIATYYMDTDDIKTARNILKISSTGIGFSSNGANGPFNTAWTIDRKFNADYIMSGILKGIEVNCQRGEIGGLNVNDGGLTYNRLGIKVGASIGDLRFSMPTTGHIDNGLIFDWSLLPSDLGPGGDELTGRLLADCLEIYGIKCADISYTSNYQMKRNIKKVNYGLKDVLNTDVYSYDLKHSNDSQSRIGFVVGDKEHYKTSSRIISYDQETGEEIGINLYSALALSYKAIQDLNDKINELETKLEEKEGL